MTRATLDPEGIPTRAPRRPWVTPAGSSLPLVWIERGSEAICTFGLFECAGAWEASGKGQVDAEAVVRRDWPRHHGGSCRTLAQMFSSWLDRGGVRQTGERHPDLSDNRGESVQVSGRTGPADIGGNKWLSR